MIHQVVTLLCDEFQIEDRARVFAIVSGKAFKEYMTLEDIAQSVCEEFDVSIEDMRCGRRHQLLVDARVRFSRVARNEYGYRFKRIAEFLGVDHTTVMHHVKHRKDSMPKYEGVRVKKIEQIFPEEAPVVKFERPKAEYTNIKSGYL